MTYSHSFSAEFYGDPYAEPETCERCKKRPLNVCDAIRAMEGPIWVGMCNDVFDCEPEFVGVDTVLNKIKETDITSNLDSPVSVWIDEEGYYTVKVYDE